MVWKNYRRHGLLEGARHPEHVQLLREMVGVGAEVEGSSPPKSFLML